MNLLITQIELFDKKYNELVPCKCKECLTTFYIKATMAKSIIKRSSNSTDTADFCSKKCNFVNRKTGNITNCKCCNKPFYSHKKLIGKKLFCSQTCAATYNNQHKEYGYRRSKLEIWIESKLKEKYSNLEIHFNKKDVINSELDIYLPSLKLAFELNGIFHYEPIYSQEQLEKIQNNDKRKFQACLERNIELCIIDSSKQKRFTEKSSQQYLDIITNIVEMKNGTGGETRTHNILLPKQAE